MLLLRVNICLLREGMMIYIHDGHQRHMLLDEGCPLLLLRAALWGSYRLEARTFLPPHRTITGCYILAMPKTERPLWKFRAKQPGIIWGKVQKENPKKLG